MNKHNDGGPAFPRPASEYTGSGSCTDGNDPIREQEGMTLHQYFAGLAMQGMVAEGNYTSGESQERLATRSLATADVMIAAYEKRAREEKSKVAAALSPVRTMTIDEVRTAFYQFGGHAEGTSAERMEMDFQAFIESAGINKPSPVAPTEAAFSMPMAPVERNAIEAPFRKQVATVEVATAPKGAYEALVYDLAKALGCAESESAIKNAVEQSENYRKHGTYISR